MTSSAHDLSVRVHQVITELTAILAELHTMPEIGDATLGLSACRHLEHELDAESDQ